MQKKVVFVTGGIRSGKSSFAENTAAQLGQKVVYIATSRVLDEEMKHRVTLHRERRPADWITVEEPLRTAAAIREHGSDCDVIMLDCLTGLISNLMFEQADVLHEIAEVCEAIDEVKSHVVVVSGEVGFSLVSENELGRRFQDLVGKANQMTAEIADEVYLVVAGYPVVVKNRR